MRHIVPRTGYRRAALVYSLTFGFAMILAVTGAAARHGRAANGGHEPVAAMDRERASLAALFCKTGDQPTGQGAGQQPNALATTFTVTRSDDISPRGTCAVGDCTLREAIIAANNTAGADTITFAASTNGNPITLTQAATTSEDFAANGDLDINESVTITGNGAGNTTIRGGGVAYGGIDKVFAVNPNCAGGGSPVVAALNGLALSHGHTSHAL